MKKLDAKIVMWKQLNLEDIRATIKTLDAEDALAMADESEYHVIDDNTCLIVADEVALLVTRSGLAIVNKMEVPLELLK